MNFTALTGPLTNMLIYANLCKWEKSNHVHFSKKREIDKAQLILGRPGRGLITCKIPTSSVTAKCCAFFSLSFPKSAHAYSFYATNFAILIKF